MECAYAYAALLAMQSAGDGVQHSLGSISVRDVVNSIYGWDAKSTTFDPSNLVVKDACTEKGEGGSIGSTR